VAQRLFLQTGFDGTSVDDIARAAGIGRRTFFRYFATKADVLFLEAPEELRRFRVALDDADPDLPGRAVIARAVLDALRYPPEEEEWALQRAQVVRQVPALLAHVYVVVLTQWQQTARDHALSRHPDREEFARATGHAVPAAIVAAHDQWLAHPGTPLAAALAEMLDLMLPPDPGPLPGHDPARAHR
jgi:AcrR family transcriptional regulator